MVVLLLLLLLLLRCILLHSFCVIRWSLLVFVVSLAAKSFVRILAAVRALHRITVLCAVRYIHMLLLRTACLFFCKKLKKLQPLRYEQPFFFHWPSPPTTNLFLSLVVVVLGFFRSISPTTPLFLFGASSGGNMATLLASRGGFQLCDKRTTYVQVSGVMSQVRAHTLSCCSCWCGAMCRSSRLVCRAVCFAPSSNWHGQSMD